MYSGEVVQMNELTSPQLKKVLPVISTVTFVGFLDTHLLIPIMSLYASDLGAGVGTVGLIIGLYSIVNTPANILFGQLVDKFGYKLLLVIGLLGDAAGMFLYSLCRLPGHLILVRIIHGITGGIVGPSTMSAASYLGGESRQGRTMAFYGMSLASATLLGYGLSGVLASRIGYDIVFYIGGGLLVVGSLLSLWLPGKRYQSPENQSETTGRLGSDRKSIKTEGAYQPLLYCLRSIFHLRQCRDAVTAIRQKSRHGRPACGHVAGVFRRHVYHCTATGQQALRPFRQVMVEYYRPVIGCHGLDINTFGSSLCLAGGSNAGIRSRFRCYFPLDFCHGS